MTFASYGMSAMEELELTCIHDFIPKDNYTDAELNQPDVPLQSKNALAEFQGFISRHGWTTNQLVESLMFIMTNNMTEANWADADRRSHCVPILTVNATARAALEGKLSVAVPPSSRHCVNSAGWTEVDDGVYTFSVELATGFVVIFR